MRLVFLISLLCIGFGRMQAQQGIPLFTDCLPYYTPGRQAMEELFTDSSKVIPGISSQISNTVNVSVVITPDGSLIADPSPYDSVSSNYSLYEEAVRLVRLTSNGWTAGMTNDMPESCRLFIPISFYPVDTIPTSERQDSAAKYADYVKARTIYSGYRYSTGPIIPRHTGYVSTQAGSADSVKVQQSMPVFRNSGADGLLEFISSQVKYPRQEVENNVQGTVYVSFVIEKDGAVKEAYIVRNVNPCLNGQALRAVYLTSHQWTPAMQNGKPVRLNMTVPVKFTLKGKGTKTKKNRKRK